MPNSSLHVMQPLLQPEHTCATELQKANREAMIPQMKQPAAITYTRFR